MEALQHDHGQDARLLSWSCHDFTNKGDNYVAAITSVNVNFSKDGRDEEATYVVKIKQNRNSDFDDMVFMKESGFYTQLLPLLNAELTNAGMAPLRIPRCLHSTWHESQSQLFLEDLRPLGFKLYDRRKPLCPRHATLVLQELGRLHAASLLLQSRSPEGELESRFPFLTWEMFNYSEKIKTAFRVLITGSLHTASLLAEAVEREDMRAWFESLGPRAVEALVQVMGSSPPFDVIGHGDCWINNILFRYDAQGQPVEVMLLDFQLCRKASLAVDLNYFLFSSMAAAERNDKLEDLLATYYAALREVVEAARVIVPFALEEVIAEFYKKTILGLIFGALAIPALLCEAKEAQEFTVASGEHTHNYVVKKRESVLKMVKNNPLMRPRLMSLYEDVKLYAANT